MNKDEILNYVLMNKKIDAYIRSISTDFNELKSDLIFQLIKMSEEKIKSIYQDGYLEYVCFKICKRIKYGGIKDSDFFYKMKKTDEFTHKNDIDTGDDYTEDRVIKIEEEINKLHWYSKTLFTLYYKQGYNYRQISELTGINLKSISYDINKTKEFLKNKFNNYD